LFKTVLVRPLYPKCYPHFAAFGHSFGPKVEEFREHVLYVVNY
jgi:hypothetical protein